MVRCDRISNYKCSIFQQYWHAHYNDIRIHHKMCYPKENWHSHKEKWWSLFWSILCINFTPYCPILITGKIELHLSLESKKEYCVSFFQVESWPSAYFLIKQFVKHIFSPVATETFLGIAFYRHCPATSRFMKSLVSLCCSTWEAHWCKSRDDCPGAMQFGGFLLLFHACHGILLSNCCQCCNWG